MELEKLIERRDALRKRDTDASLMRVTNAFQAVDMALEFQRIISEYDNLLSDALCKLTPDEGDAKCKNCAGTGWVCESHQTTPWWGVMPNEEENRCCGDCGVPCPKCLEIVKKETS